jgi:hypothetical protein
LVHLVLEQVSPLENQCPNKISEVKPVQILCKSQVGKEFFQCPGTQSRPIEECPPLVETYDGPLVVNL